MRNLQTVPSLSGTFSIRTRLALNPKMLKEPSSPSHTIVPSVKHCSKIETFELNEENSQHITRGHKTLGDKWLFEPHFSYQGSRYLDSEVASKSPTFHTAIRQTV